MIVVLLGVIAGLLSVILAVLLLGRQRFLRALWSFCFAGGLAMLTALLARGIARTLGATPLQVARTTLLTAAGVFLLCISASVTLAAIEFLFGWHRIGMFVGRLCGLTEEQVRKDEEFEAQFAAAWKRRDFKEMRATLHKAAAFASGAVGKMEDAEPEQSTIERNKSSTPSAKVDPAMARAFFRLCQLFDAQKPGNKEDALKVFHHWLRKQTGAEKLAERAAASGDAFVLDVYELYCRMTPAERAAVAAVNDAPS